MSTIIEDLRWLAEVRSSYLLGDARKMYNGGTGSYWSLDPVDQAMFAEATTARFMANILSGESESWGWVPSLFWDEWQQREQARADRHAEAEALRAEIEHWVKDYMRLYRVPYGLPPNLTLATRALALLHAETGL